MRTSNGELGCLRNAHPRDCVQVLKTGLQLHPVTIRLWVDEIDSKCVTDGGVP